MNRAQLAYVCGLIRRNNPPVHARLTEAANHAARAAPMLGAMTGREVCAAIDAAVNLQLVVECFAAERRGATIL